MRRRDEHENTSVTRHITRNKGESTVIITIRLMKVLLGAWGPSICVAAIVHRSTKFWLCLR